MEFEIVAVPERYALTATATCAPDQVGPTISQLFGRILESSPEVELIAPPCIFYRRWSETDCDLEAAVIVDPLVEGKEKCKTFPMCRALTMTHVGHYDGLAHAWSLMWAEMARQGLNSNGDLWDSYVTDPGEVPNPDEWITELYIALE